MQTEATNHGEKSARANTLQREREREREREGEGEREREGGREEVIHPA
jgi:hypothetical protein